MARATMTHTECVACGCMLMPLSKWRHMTAEQRRVFTELGGSAHEGRGLCRIDYHQARRDGTLLDYERTMVPLELVLEEWPRIKDPDRSRNANVEAHAHRLGMTPSALEQALVRAERKGLLVA